ncbi:MAG: formimidoylglutamate deiminase [Proteobacteria bacterium]|nr:formimidoylglutamate deiminase [Pseudomonadota bacterium]
MPDTGGTTTLYARQALLTDGWADNVAVEIDNRGLISSIKTDLDNAPQGAEVLDGTLLPGIQNCHSHAFQRAITGLTEQRLNPEDSFWSWRDTMYRMLGKIGPEELQAIAGQLYLDMLKQGYTGVAEFHYLHHGCDGSHYSNRAEMSHRVITAARTVGIHITHLPVLYCFSDFGSKPPEDSQRRFVHSLDGFQQLLATLHRDYKNDPNVQLGIAPHSLRAVDKTMLEGLIRCQDELDNKAPIHIHIAEQQREVQACLDFCGQRPVQWLLDNFDVNSRWCLIHATHLQTSEVESLANSAAVAGLCPTTEANLGDGLFPAVDYLQRGGAFAVGSDSQVCVSPAEELRLLEYGQRLQQQRRTLLANDQQPSVGENLLRGALRGGSAALGINAGAIATGKRADLIMLDDQHPALYGKRSSSLLDSWIFASNENPVKDVMVNGQWLVRNGCHNQQAVIAARFRTAMDAIL